jgi:TolA-binding protein
MVLDSPAEILETKEIPMPGRRVRRLPSWSILFLLALLLPVGWGCDMHHSSSSSGSASTSSSDEAERTRKMEEKAAEIRQKEEEIRNMQGTDEEKAEAVNKLDQERRELQEMQDQGK